ncbi:hypothetical protein [Brachybacterium phenoliresistens]|uniref:hypothetical protein n=1 Tax=Brachybacterium phenoliresistens TaxID=396014 RepID=UPI0031DC9AF7
MATLPFRTETELPADEDGDLVVKDLRYAKRAAMHATAWARLNRPALAASQIREARAALDRAERILARYTPPDPT